MTWLIYILFFMAVTMVVLAFAKPQSKEEASARLQYLKIKKGLQEDPSAKDNLEKAKAMGQQWATDSHSQLAPIAARLLPSNLYKLIRRKLDLAGLYSTTVEIYAVNQLLYMLGFPLTFLAFNLFLFKYPFMTVIYAVPVLLAIGYYFPIVRLNTLVETRRRGIFRAFPDFVDLMTICLEAGMGIDAALTLMLKKSQPTPLRDELAKTLQEIRVGKPRVQALKDLAKRVDMKEVSSFVIAVVQAEQIGGSLSQTLKIQSEIARDARWQKAQELAQKAPIKLLFPMLLLIFPNIFLIIFGPILLGYITGKL
jgi:tight adherence protein C